MAIVKKTFVDGVTTICAQELNDWQDELIRLDAEKEADGLGISEASAGQYVKIKTVDSDGRPTSFEPGSGGGGGGGTDDYADLTNKPQINGVTLSGNKSASDLGLYPAQNNGIPKTDLAAAVQTSLGKADTALQTAPVTSVDGKTGQVAILPAGGSSGQYLKKASGADFDVTWGDGGGGGGGGTSDYTDLSNKPKINNVELSGNRSASDLGLGTYSKPSGGIPASDLSAAAQTSLGKADTAYQKPSGGIPPTDLASGVQASLGAADTAYQVPSSGIPKTDLASAVQASLGAADTAYQKASGGIPKTDLAAAVQTSLGAADTAYQKPSGGIPASDMAGAVQTSLGLANSAYQKPNSGIPASDLASGVIPGAYTSNPAMDGQASPGGASTVAYAKGDHVHPTDTSRQAAIKIGSIAISGSGWSGSGPYTQTVSIPGLTPTANTKVDLQPSAAAFAQMITDNVQALFVASEADPNNSGSYILKLYAIGGYITASSLAVQCTYYEVS